MAGEGYLGLVPGLRALKSVSSHHLMLPDLLMSPLLLHAEVAADTQMDSYQQTHTEQMSSGILAVHPLCMMVSVRRAIKQGQNERTYEY